MGPAQYVIRLDDACPTMQPDRWSQIEKILEVNAISPIVAVVPDNRDPELIRSRPDKDFWNRVRNWQDKGWSIAMHGLSHRLEEVRAQQILPYHKVSEFSELPYEAQALKIRNAKAIFDAQRVRVDAFIAPAHGFDDITLKVLERVTDIKIICDGIAFFPYYEWDFFWVPQQLWQFRRMPLGLWTVCLHPNSMDNAAIDLLHRDILCYKKKIINFRDIIFTLRRRNSADRLLNAVYWLMRRKICAVFHCL